MCALSRSQLNMALKKRSVDRKDFIWFGSRQQLMEMYRNQGAPDKETQNKAFCRAFIIFGPAN